MDGVCADCWVVKDEAAVRLRPRPRTQALLDWDWDDIATWVAAGLVGAVGLAALGTLVRWISG